VNVGSGCWQQALLFSLLVRFLYLFMLSCELGGENWFACMPVFAPSAPPLWFYFAPATCCLLASTGRTSPSPALPLHCTLAAGQTWAAAVERQGRDADEHLYTEHYTHGAAYAFYSIQVAWPPPLGALNAGVLYAQRPIWLLRMALPHLLCVLAVAALLCGRGTVQRRVR